MMETHALLFGIGFAFVCGVFSELDDPCSTYQPLPRAAYRGGNCSCDLEKAVCDVHLNPTTWYRAEGLNGYLTMQESPAPLMKCGTKYPLWMNGTHPAVSDGEVERQACQSTVSNTCFSSKTIKVKTCGTQSDTVCVKIGDNCCAESFTIGSKQCTDFMVYHLSDDFSGKCQRYCTDDASATCPPIDIHTTTIEPDHHEDKDKDETRGGALWVIPLALCVLLVGICVGSGVTYIIVKKMQKQKIRDSKSFDNICDHDQKKQEYFTTPRASHKCP